MMKVVFIAPSEHRGALNLALIGAKLIHLVRDTDATNTWIAEVVPEKGTHKSGNTVPFKDLTMVFPLTVAPKIEPKAIGAKQITEFSVNSVLASRGTPGAPFYDFNGDGRVDYIDDYILMSSFLAL